MGSPPLPRLIRARGVGLLWLVLVVLLTPAGVEAQEGEGECDVPSHQGLVMTTLSNDTRMLFFQVPTIRCPGGVRIRADSARVYESTNYTQLWGNVVFWDDDTRLTSEEAQYFSDQRRLRASRNAVLTDLTEGSVIRGDDIQLTRAGPGQDEDILMVTGRRPHATLYPGRRPDTASAAPDTMASGGQEAVGDTVTAAPDTLALPPDTAAVTDTLAAPPDTLVAVPDTLPALPDTAVVIPDSLATVVSVDSVGFPEAPPDTAAAQGDSLLVRLDSADVEPPAQPEPEAPRVPYEIDARRFDLEGTRYFRASGDVIVTRDSLRAEADSLEYDQDLGALFLIQEAKVTTAQTDLEADDIRLDIPEDDIREALATGDAVLVGEDLRMLAPIVTIFFTEGMMERLVAVRDAVADSLLAEMDDEERERVRLMKGAPPLVARELGFEEFPRRPYALAQDFVLEGDSLEVLAPGEVLQEVKAMGTARGETSGADSLVNEDTPALLSRDWLEGDTIVAYFQEAGDSLTVVGEGAPQPGDSLATDTTAADTAVADTAGAVATVAATAVADPEVEDPEVADPQGAVPEPQEGQETPPDSAEAEFILQRLLALGNARSMYRMAPTDSTLVGQPGRFAIHYVIGDEITILLNPEGEAEKMEVVGETRGIHLEPLSPGQLADSLAADTLVVPDTLAVFPDTSAVAPDTSAVIPDTTWVRPDTSLVRRGGGSGG